jgi:hypothetical protein
MLLLSQNDRSDHQQRKKLETLRDDCLNEKNDERPLFYTINLQMKDIMFSEI